MVNVAIVCGAGPQKALGATETTEPGGPQATTLTREETELYLIGAGVPEDVAQDVCDKGYAAVGNDPKLSFILTCKILAMQQNGVDITSPEKLREPCPLPTGPLGLTE